MPPAREPDLAIARIRAEVERRLAIAAPRDGGLALRTLRKLTPERWVLEWHLPWWLGEAFGLDAARADALVVSNLIGLTSLRLLDDLQDGELAENDRAEAERLAPILLDAALDTYRAELPPDSPFWPFYSRTMAAWHAANGDPAADPVDRAAPLRLPALAICLLTAGVERWPALDRCLVHAIAALVLYDQLIDWEDDLAAGRWNAFVASITAGPQDAAHRDRNRAAVLAALLARGAAGAEYAHVEAEARAAAAIAGELGVEPLRTFLAEYADRTADQGETVQRHYDQVADQAVGLMFGSRGSD